MLILVFDSDKIKIVKFIQDSVFVRRKPGAEIERVLDICFWKMYSLFISSNIWLCKTFSKRTWKLLWFVYPFSMSLPISIQFYSIDFHPTDFWGFKTTHGKCEWDSKWIKTYEFLFYLYSYRRFNSSIKQT